MESKKRHLKKDGLGHVVFASLAAFIGFVGLAVLLWIDTAAAAIPRLKPVASIAGAAYQCEDRLANTYLAGSFVMPSSGEEMQLWVGKPRGVANAETEVWGLLGKSAGEKCEAQCKVTRFERFRADLRPALMELECEGTRLKTMRMPLHIQWVRSENGKFETLVRMGSSIYGVEEVSLRLAVNRYAVALAPKK